jgi:starvation-inducible DNA-binding protein
MTTTAAPSHLPALGSHQRARVGQELQATLLELIDLSLLGKQLHWSVVGPHFRSLHLQLDELVDAWHGLADTVAERVVAIGAWPDGQAKAVVVDSSLPGVERGGIRDREVVEHLARVLEDAAERIRERMDRLGELEIASQDVLIDVVRALEAHLWMVRAQLPPHGR